MGTHKLHFSRNFWAYLLIWDYLHFRWNDKKGLITSKGSLSVSTKTKGKGDDAQKRPGSTVTKPQRRKLTLSHTPRKLSKTGVDADETRGARANPRTTDGASWDRRARLRRLGARGPTPRRPRAVGLGCRRRPPRFSSSQGPA